MEFLLPTMTFGFYVCYQTICFTYTILNGLNSRGVTADWREVIAVILKAFFAFFFLWVGGEAWYRRGG